MKLSNIMDFDFKQQIIAGWGWLILLSSSFFLFCSQSFLVSSIFYSVNFFLSLYFILFYKKIVLYSPKFSLLSSIFINATFVALYYFSSVNNIFSYPRPLDNVLYLEIAGMYFVFILMMVLPFFLLSSVKLNVKLDFLKINFNVDTLVLYYYVSTVIILLLMILAFVFIGTSPLEALKNPWAFRMDIGSGEMAYFHRTIRALRNINTVLILKSIIVDNIRTKKFKFIAVAHFVLLIFYGLVGGARREFLFPVFTAILIYAVFKKIRLKELLTGMLAGGILLTFLSFYVMYRNYAIVLSSANPTSNSVDFEEFTKGRNTFENTVARLGAFEKTCIFFDYIDRNYDTLFYFKSYHLTQQLEAQLTYAIPRSIYPSKKYSFMPTVTDLIYPHLHGKAAFSWGGIANSFWNLGVAGIILEGFLFGIFVWFLEKNFLSLINYDMFFLLYFGYIYTMIPYFIETGLLNTVQLNDLSLGLIIMIVLAFALTKKYKFKI